MMKALIDTDVILDFLIGRKPFNKDANQIFTACETQKMKAYITPVIISNTYYILRKTESHESVISILKSLLTIVDVLKIDKNDVLKAINSDFKDFEYALQSYCAESNGAINTIITRNYKDYQKSNLGVFTPSQFVKQFL